MTFNLARAVVMVVAVAVREVGVGHFFNQKEGPDAHDYQQVCLHVFLAVAVGRATVPITTMAVVMRVGMATTQVRNRVEKDVTKETSHCE